MRLQSAIFDMDGTLLDSMPTWRELGPTFLKEAGISATPEQDRMLHTLADCDVIPYLREVCGLPWSQQEIIDQIIQRMETFYSSQVRPKPGLEKFLSILKMEGVWMYVATATHRRLTEKALKLGAKGMAWIALKDDGEPYSILTKYFSQEEFQSLLDAVDGKPGDFILFCADQFSTVCRTLGGLRLELADMLGLRKPGDYRFLIVTDFPEFEYSQEEGRYLATHHPFTMPYPEDIPYLISDPARVRAQAYDVVLNGVELGSGSMRIHQKDVQRKMFEALGFSEEQIQERFGFMVNAFQYGTPPHGGFAFGLDRLAMQMLEAESLRDVIAFPKNKDAVCPMTQAPNVVDPHQLEVLGLAALLSKEGTGKAVQKRQRPKIDVENVANLSKLLLSPEEKEAAAKDMEEIVEFANQLQAIDTENIPAAAHTAKLTNVFREDIPQTSCPRELLLENAPEQHDGCVFVPQVVE